MSNKKDSDAREMYDEAMQVRQKDWLVISQCMWNFFFNNFFFLNMT